MTSRIPDTHAEAWDLLPWLANGRIAAGDREWVEAHVQAFVRLQVQHQHVWLHGLHREHGQRWFLELNDDL
jgi:hypothetical protein